MKAVFSVLIFWSGLCGSFAQSTSEVNIWLGENQNQAEEYVLVINNKRITLFKPRELVHLKLVSSGYFNMEIVSSRYGVTRYNEQFQVKGGEQIFLHCNMVGYPAKGVVEALSQEQAEDFYKREGYFIKTRYFEDSRQDPFGTLSRKGPKQGTGFLVHPSGYLLTNFHVVDEVESISVTGIQGDFSTVFSAKLVASDEALDLALLKLSSDLIKFDAPPYSFPFSTQVSTGEDVFAYGYPVVKLMGEEIKVTKGIVNSTKGYKNSTSQFQFSAAVQPGNSGGPILNAKGEVVGITTSKISGSSIESVGYAMKSAYINLFLSEVPELKDFKSTSALKPGTEAVQVINVMKNFVFIVKTE